MGQVRGNVCPKIWGTTEPLMISEWMQLHRITFEAGGVCSEHLHNRRYNAFYVLSGELLIRQWRSNGDEDSRLLKAHEHMSVPAGVRHQFEAVKSGVALEIYYPFPRDFGVVTEDIYRFTQGFMR